MIGKVIAGVVCGAAAALPGKYMLASIAASLIIFLGDSSQLELAITVVPFFVFALGVFIGVIAPNALGAWLRGCLLVVVVSTVLALQSLQCFGIEYFFERMFDDAAVVRDATIACPKDVTPTMTGLSIAAAIIFGITAILVWRRAKQAGEHDY